MNPTKALAELFGGLEFGGMLVVGRAGREGCGAMEGLEGPEGAPDDEDIVERACGDGC